MPDGKTHIVIGAAVAAATYFVLNKIGTISTEFAPYEWLILAVIVYLYSQLPDIDADVSTINKLWNSAAAIFGMYAIWSGQYKLLGLVAVGSILALEWVKHRGVTHEEWFGVLMAIPLWMFEPAFAIIALTTYISHIWADGDAFR